MTPVQQESSEISFDSLSPYRRWLLVHADADYVSARVLYYLNICYPKVAFLCREALEKYLKLLLLHIHHVSDDQADLFLRRYNHGLSEICDTVAQVARERQELRFQMIFEESFFKNSVAMMESYRSSTRYPGFFALPGSIVETADRLIENVREFCLRMTPSPLEVVLKRLGPMEGWPSTNGQLVTVAFYHENRKYSQASHEP